MGVHAKDEKGKMGEIEAKHNENVEANDGEMITYDRVTGREGGLALILGDGADTEEEL